MTYSTKYMVDHTGATARQLTKWVEKGWLDGGGVSTGTGHSREWTQRDLDTARLMMRFMRSGFRLEGAYKLAKAIVGKQIADGVRIRIGENMWVIVKEI